jgi:tRNA A-37 threonylcarbamoyl transferase component Bud32
LYYRAAAYNLAGRFSEAAEDATRALMVDPTDIRARDARAWAYNSLGRFRDAIADSNHSLEINPANAYAYWNLGYAREHVGDVSGMANALKTAATLSPQFEPAFRDAAARHGLEPRPLQRPEPGKGEQARRKSFVVVILSSVVGGLLIAAGFIQLYGDTRARPGTPALARLNSLYTLGKPLGRGGMGLVYEAYDKALQRKVAVKIMRPETVQERGSRERFLEEARTVAGLHHPAIVDIHAIVEDKDGLCLVFERIDGRTLADVLAERKRLTLPQARSLLKPICQALEYAHSCGVVHRDLKPANIMVTALGQVKIMDFGISRHERREPAPLTPAERASARGTPTYMAPEQEYGEVRRESDVYSLGACLYEMITGRMPFPSAYSTADKLARRYDRASTIIAGLPPLVDALIDQALEPDPLQRIKSPGEFLQRLERI